jgi:lipid II:glycine glycyltransferase (peptidoglycan interpeptide bridge formation enzyme)
MPADCLSITPSTSKEEFGSLEEGDRVFCIGEESRKTWDELTLQEPGFALLQSWEWGQFKEKLGWSVFRVAVEQKRQVVCGAQMLVKVLPLNLGSIAYIPRGPLGNFNDNDIAIKLLLKLHEIARDHKCIFLRIEPRALFSPSTDQWFRSHQFHKNRRSNQPRATIILDLTPDIQTIFSNFRRQTKQNINRAEREGVTVRMGGKEHLPILFDLIKATGRRSGFSVRTRAYYQHELSAFLPNDRMALMIADWQGQVAAVRTIMACGSHAAEFHAGSATECRHLRADYRLSWEGIQWAKSRGCITYDLWGIPDEVGQIVHDRNELPKPDRHDGLWGVYQFKRSLSTNVVYYAGTYDYVYAPLRYRGMEWFLANKDNLDRFMSWLDKETRVPFGV